MEFFKTLDQIDGADRKQEFIENIVAHLRKFEGYHEKSIELRTGEISYRLPQITDDRITYLIYNDEFIVASVMEVRTLSNKTAHNFFENLDGFQKYLERNK